MCGPNALLSHHQTGKAAGQTGSPDDKPLEIFGCLAGKIEIVGDIVSPVTPLEDWKGLK